MDLTLSSIIRFVVDAASFLIVLFSLEICWGNIKAYWHDKSYGKVLQWALLCALILAVVSVVATAAHEHFL